MGWRGVDRWYSRGTTCEDECQYVLKLKPHLLMMLAPFFSFILIFTCSENLIDALAAHNVGE